MHSRWLTLTAWACACAALMMTAQTRAATPIAWQTHWKNALFTRAKREHRFVLLDLHAVWCHWCHVMDEKTYSDPRVQALMAKYYVTVSVDADEYPDLTSRYGDWGWPATLSRMRTPPPGSSMRRSCWQIASCRPRRFTSPWSAAMATRRRRPCIARRCAIRPITCRSTGGIPPRGGCRIRRFSTRNSGGQPPLRAAAAPARRRCSKPMRSRRRCVPRSCPRLRPRRPSGATSAVSSANRLRSCSSRIYPRRICAPLPRGRSEYRAFRR